MNKKLGEIEFEDFLEAVKAQIETRRDVDRIKEIYPEEQYENSVISICEEIYREENYKNGTLRGGVHGAVRRLTERVYEVSTSVKIEERIEKGELKLWKGVVLGSYDREQNRKDGSGTFMKTYMPLIQTENGKITEITTYGEVIGGERYGKPIPYLKEAEYIIDESSYYSPFLGRDVPENKAIRFRNVSEEELSIESLLELAKKKGNYYNVSSLVKAYDEGKLEEYTWIWFEGVVNNVVPTPIWEGKNRTDEKHFLIAPTRAGDSCFTFTTKSRGITINNERYYPNVRLNAVQVAKTHVDWGDVRDWVYSLVDSEAISPEVQLITLRDQILGRKFYALAKFNGITKGEPRPIRGGEEGETRVVNFINLNCVCFILTNEEVPWTPIDENIVNEEKEVIEEVEEAVKESEKKVVKKQAGEEKEKRREKIVTEIKTYLEVLPDATFEDMKNDQLFKDFSDMNDAALKAIVRQVKGE